MKKLEIYPTLPSKFDLKVDDLYRYHQTLDIVDLLRLAMPYMSEKLKKEVTPNQMVEVVKKFLFAFLRHNANSGEVTILPHNLAMFQCFAVKGERIKKSYSWRSYSDPKRLRKAFVLDRDAEWEREWKYSGYDWRMETFLPLDYDYFTVDFSDEIKEYVRQQARKTKYQEKDANKSK